MSRRIELLDWVKNTIEVRKQMRRDILESEEMNGPFQYKVTYTNKIEFYIIQEILSIQALRTLFDTQHLVIVVPNNRENVLKLYEQWSEWIPHNTLKIIFVNPTEGLFWSVSPSVHNMFAEKNALKQGLLSLYQTVPAA